VGYLMVEAVEQDQDDVVLHDCSAGVSVITASSPSRGKPAPTGTAQHLATVLYLWERA